jgi:hypothetical protein
MTRKRKYCDATDAAPRKRRVQAVNNQRYNHKHKLTHKHTRNDNPSVSHELLSLYYPRVVSLRYFLLSSLPLLSTSCWRRVSTYGSGIQAGTRQPHFLDATVVGAFSEPQITVKDARKRDFAAFTQSQQKSLKNSNGSTQSHHFAEVSNPVRKKLSRTRASLDVSLVSTDAFRLWNLLYGRSFIEQDPHPRDRTIYFALVSTVALLIIHKTRQELCPA